eukprot:5670438-Pleurochrysis_carterae.AAC.1
MQGGCGPNPAEVGPRRGMITSLADLKGSTASPPLPTKASSPGTSFIASSVSRLAWSNGAARAPLRLDEARMSKRCRTHKIEVESAAVKCTVTLPQSSSGSEDAGRCRAACVSDSDEKRYDAPSPRQAVQARASARGGTGGSGRGRKSSGKPEAAEAEWESAHLIAKRACTRPLSVQAAKCGPRYNACVAVPSTSIRDSEAKRNRRRVTQTRGPGPSCDVRARLVEQQLAVAQQHREQRPRACAESGRRGWTHDGVERKRVRSTPLIVFFREAMCMACSQERACVCS